MTEFINVTVQVPKAEAREILEAACRKRGLYHNGAKVAITDVPLNVLVKCVRTDWAADLEATDQKEVIGKFQKGDGPAPSRERLNLQIVKEADEDDDTGRTGKREARANTE